MNRKILLLLMLIAVPPPALSAEDAACAAAATAVDANLREAALARTLSVTAPDPAIVAASQQTFTSAMRLVEQNVALLTQGGCAPFPRPLDFSGYSSDAMYCAYEILQQRPDSAACNRRSWTLKGQIETWHSFGAQGRRSD